MSLSALNDLHKLFTETDKQNTGYLELQEFKTVVRKALRINGKVSNSSKTLIAVQNRIFYFKLE